MALSKLDSLYKAVVTDHSAHPHHHGKLEDVEQVVLNNPNLWRCYQPVCEV